MNRTRAVIVVFIGLVVLSPLAGETIAVAVRERSEHEQSAALAARTEQGAMDRFFSAGHIVFGLDIDPLDEVYTCRAIDRARDGGAGFVVVLELSSAGVSERELVPDAVGVAVVDARTEEELAQGAFRSEDLESIDELTPQTIADRLGVLAAERALETIAGDTDAW
ncbi:MAG: hypothetical protein ACOCW3_01605 [Spirochaetota bacterium]